MDDLLRKNIRDILPHREPFIFIDKVLEAGPGSVVASKTIKGDEDYFKGHFPGRPLMPGVLIVECMAQAAGLACSTLGEETQGALFFLSRIADVKFKRPVMPGSTLVLRAQVADKFPPFYKVSVTCEVGEKAVAEGEIVLTKQPEGVA
ncbi:MAG: 3-hydroxyacyl-ACP dehydratase FabZ [Candidatus Omnitrophica bacterium]|nr:3-hydroxyacyl-ACP dehydratase FabZ [Candidatus Omnitrophota bacterium]